jgi:hypothetical protein
LLGGDRCDAKETMKMMSGGRRGPEAITGRLTAILGGMALAALVTGCVQPNNVTGVMFRDAGGSTALDGSAPPPSGRDADRGGGMDGQRPSPTLDAPVAPSPDAPVTPPPDAAPVGPPPVVCQPVPEICDNGLDDDCDARIDCDDSDCPTARRCGVDRVCGSGSCNPCRPDQTCGGSACSTGKTSCATGHEECVETPKRDGTSCGQTSCAGGSKTVPSCSGGICDQPSIDCPGPFCNGSGTDCEPCGALGQMCCRNDGCNSSLECRSGLCERPCAGTLCGDRCDPNKGACWFQYTGPEGGGCGNRSLCDPDTVNCAFTSQVKRVFFPTNDLAELKRLCQPIATQTIRDFCAANPNIVRRRNNGETVLITFLVVGYRPDGFDLAQDEVGEPPCP